MARINYGACGNNCHIPYMVIIVQKKLLDLRISSNIELYNPKRQCVKRNYKRSFSKSEERKVLFLHTKQCLDKKECCFNLYSFIMYIISWDLMLIVPAHAVVHFTICIWQITSISPYRKYARYGKTSHMVWKQTSSLFCIFLRLPENTKI